MIMAGGHRDFFSPNGSVGAVSQHGPYPACLALHAWIRRRGVERTRDFRESLQAREIDIRAGGKVMREFIAVAGA